MITLTPKIFEARKLPPIGEHPGLQNGKHYRPLNVNGLWYNHGGDWDDTNGNSSSQQEVYSYDVGIPTGQEDSAGWIKQYQYCPPVLETCPGGPDQLTVVRDTNRNKTWVLPGYTPGTPDNVVHEARLVNSLSAGGSETDIQVYFLGAGWVDEFISSGYTAKSFAIVNDDFLTATIQFERVTYTSYTKDDAFHGTFHGCTRGFGGTPKPAHAANEYISVTGVPPCGAATTRAAIPWAAYSFDNNRTQKYRLESKVRPWTSLGEGASNGFFDPVTDRIYRILNGNNQDAGGPFFTIEIFNPGANLALTTITRNFPLPTLQQTVGYEYFAWNPIDRIAYIISPGVLPSEVGTKTARMFSFSPDTLVLTEILGSGKPPRTATIGTGGDGSGGFDISYFTWDTVNNVGLYPFIQNFGSGGQTDSSADNASLDLWIYHKNAGFGFPANSWEHDAMICKVGSPFIPGFPPRPRCNSAAFIHEQNCAIFAGRTGIPYLWLYRYANAGNPYRPTGLAGAVL